ncbi:MAG: TatD family hydrolase [Gammaproteobacteria bacterium]|nr:TatD family hydrolase [Gammaproteobacteria bacterium]
MLTDSHCHLDRLELTPFDGELANALAFARERGVERLLCVAIDMENIPAVLELARRYPQVYASVGVHPNEQGREEPTVEQLLELASNDKVIAIGETGLDYFRSEGDLHWQHQRFRTHIAAAKACNKPLIIHCREAREDLLRMLEEEGADAVGGVMHCFVEDLATAERAMALGFYISFSGIITFNSARELRAVAQAVPADRLLVETDAPYLAPVPYRGKSNQPAYVREVAEYIAGLRGVSYEAIAQQTGENFNTLFRLN